MPARFSSIEKAAKTFGILVVKGGKHNKKLVRAGSRCYMIPAHNGGVVAVRFSLSYTLRIHLIAVSRFTEG